VDANTKALKSQVRKAQALIAQFEDGTGRHNSNLLGTERDAGAVVNLNAIQPRYFGPVFVFDHGTITPKDELETYLIHCGALRAKPKDCQIGRIVRLEEIDCDGRWARARGDYQRGLAVLAELDAPSREIIMNVFEFERTRYHHRGTERAFWKRIA